MATLDELINSMYDMVQDAKGIPLAGEKCILERDRLLDLLDELRATLPNDLKTAQDIVEKRSEMLASGKREAESIRRQAEEGQAQPHLSGGAGCEKRIRHASRLLGGHSPAVVDDLQRQGVLRAAFLHNNLRQGSPCRQGVLGDIHYIQRQLPHGFIRTLPKCP